MFRLVAQVISLVFHPLLVVSYMLLVLMLVNPYLFGIGRINEPIGMVFLLRITLFTFFMPVFATVMLRFLGMIDSLRLKSREEHYIPYIIAGVFYLWVVVNFLNNSNVPIVFTTFLLGATIALFLAFFINLFSMISAHAVGMGSLLAMVIITILFFSYETFEIKAFLVGDLQINTSLLLIGVILITGLVGTARLAITQHRPADIYGGYLIGILSQLIAMRILYL